MIIPVCIFFTLFAQSAAAQDGGAIVFNRARLDQYKVLFESGQVKQKPELKRILRDAEKILAAEPYSILDKKLTPPSGDKRDYYSLARYYWPDPSKKDGLPYVRRDGEVNPEIESLSDDKNLHRFFKETALLGAAYYISRDKKYLDRGIGLITTWLVDTVTRMNPNLLYAQVVKGVGKNNYSGLIDCSDIYFLIGGLRLFALTGALPERFSSDVNGWLERYYQWLVESPQGRREAKSKNNHGSWYHSQLITIALYLGKTGEAKQYIERVQNELIPGQIEPDGKQPLELARTLSMKYSCYNLMALTTIANAAEAAGVDVWNYSTADGRGIRRAVEYVFSFVKNPKDWPDKQIAEFQIDDYFEIFAQAAVRYNKPEYMKTLNEVLSPKAKESYKLVVY